MGYSKFCSSGIRNIFEGKLRVLEHSPRQSSITVLLFELIIFFRFKFLNKL